MKVCYLHLVCRQSPQTDEEGPECPKSLRIDTNSLCVVAFVDLPVITGEIQDVRETWTFCPLCATHNLGCGELRGLLDMLEKCIRTKKRR